MKNEGTLFQCCNPFGESLIHMACRRGSFEVVEFFTKEANVDIKCRDDFGRTPMHDACWTSNPNFELIELLVTLCPELLSLTDVRGHSPLQYIRREHWPLWLSFLEKHQDRFKTTC
jgi:ankyrin repeat protein